MWQTRDVILDPHRIQRPGRRIEWRVSLNTHMKFRDLLGELVDLESYPRSHELERRMESLREEIRCLPGFPRDYHPEDDTIVPVTTSAQR